MQDTLTPGDILSVMALVDHLAYQKKLQRESTCFLLEQEFQVSNVNHIRRTDLDRAISFLVDLQDINLH